MRNSHFANFDINISKKLAKNTNINATLYYTNNTAKCDMGFMTGESCTYVQKEKVKTIQLTEIILHFEIQFWKKIF